MHVWVHIKSVARQGGADCLLVCICSLQAHAVAATVQVNCHLLLLPAVLKAVQTAQTHTSAECRSSDTSTLVTPDTALHNTSTQRQRPKGVCIGVCTAEGVWQAECQ